MFGMGQIEPVMDIVQDTFETALSRWRFSGIPENPSGWLMRVAKNKAVNALRRTNKTLTLSPSAYADHFESSFEEQFDFLLSPNQIRDSQLKLLLTCCHPSFSPRNQVIITLYVLCGFGVPEIANALLMNEEAVKKALTRSKAQLKNESITERNHTSPSGERITTAHTILYLMYNEGYKTTRGKEAMNNDLCYEAIRLARLLENDASEKNSETCALLALMFFTLSRFPERMNVTGEWLTLEEQDRSRWNRVFIEEGYFYLNKATQARSLSRYHLEAIISSVHCSAAVFAATDWTKIAFLYRQLEALEPESPLVTLNRIIAESYLTHTNSIAALDALSGEPMLKNSFLLPAARGDIYKRKGELMKAMAAYETALALAVSPTDRHFLKKKIVQCQTSNN